MLGLFGKAGSRAAERLRSAVMQCKDELPGALAQALAQVGGWLTCARW